MTDHQQAKLAAYTATETVLDAHPEPLAGIPAAQRAITTFKDTLQALRAAAQAQAAYTPQGAAKQALRDALIAAAVPVAQAIAAFADEQGNIALADKIAFHRSDFRVCSQQDALDRALLVRDTATTHAAALAEYGVTPADITALSDATDAFAAGLVRPRHAIVERMVHTQAIQTAIAQIDAILARRLDRLVAQATGTPFHTEYHAARRIVDR